MKAEVDNLLYALRYQYPSGITTMGHCANGCGGHARGSGRCKECLAKELIALGCDPTKLAKLHVALETLVKTKCDIESLTEELRT